MSDKELLEEIAALKNVHRRAVHKATELLVRNKRLSDACEHALKFIVNGIALGCIQLPDPELNDTANQTERIIREALEANKIDVENKVILLTPHMVTAARRLLAMTVGDLREALKHVRSSKVLEAALVLLEQGGAGYGSGKTHAKLIASALRKVEKNMESKDE